MLLIISEANVKKKYNKTDSRGSFSPSCVLPTPLGPLATGVIILYTGDSVGRHCRRLSSLGVLTVCVRVSGSNRSGGETIVWICLCVSACVCLCVRTTAQRPPPPEIVVYDTNMV